MEVTLPHRSIQMKQRIHKAVRVHSVVLVKWRQLLPVFLELSPFYIISKLICFLTQELLVSLYFPPLTGHSNVITGGCRFSHMRHSDGKPFLPSCCRQDPGKEQFRKCLKKPTEHLSSRKTQEWKVGLLSCWSSF